MATRNTTDRYGSVTIALHWLTAIVVIAMLGTAAWAWVAPNGDIEGDRLYVHGAIGMLAYLLIAARIVWHFVEQRPRPLPGSAALRQLAKTVQVTMLILIAFQLLSGPIDIWTGGWPIDVFGWFAVPSPVGAVFKPWHDAIGAMHRYAGYAIAALLALHVSAALYHGLIRRDGVLQRMLSTR